VAGFKSESVADFKSEWVADLRRNPHVFAQKPRSNAMERPRPGQGIAHYAGVRADHLPAYPLNAPGHLGCRAA